MVELSLSCPRRRASSSGRAILQAESNIVDARFRGNDDSDPFAIVIAIMKGSTNHPS
jgi:hypothetical protein